MKLTREKDLKNILPGQVHKIKKISEAEFILYVKKELPELFAAAVSQKSSEKFADILELINNTCEILNMDWYECSKIKSSKRWESGKYGLIVSEKTDKLG